MAAELKRFTITIPQEMKSDLNVAKERNYKEDTQSQMIRDLIARGLDTLKAEKKEEGSGHGKSA